ncbi:MULTISPECIES: hypothetical protein [Pseudoalteromonas]|uniref:Natural product n=1 Tax=Pseudoalteromonas obscura TaxID=3048491 RepID=A0ABT7EM43_9GAMM|nr:MULTISPECIES: hypothetical protein [Pseudoalteromonas]MBQ4837955.1 hypothetical protein [Pseudoalteromonas luteoviolacea]MDK2596099.1 hypothetical protein [Pseudoalteromonas sp. P94(2023)]
MKLSLNKKKIKSLSQDNKQLPNQATPAIAGGRLTDNCTNNYYSNKFQNCNTLIHTDRNQTACCPSAAC